MLKRITLATALVLSAASGAYASHDRDRDRDDSLSDRQSSGACQRAVAPNICR
jgi:hypothetical protein